MTEAPAGKDDVDKDLAADLRRARNMPLPTPEQQPHPTEPMSAAVDGKTHTPLTYVAAQFVGKEAAACHLVWLGRRKDISSEASTRGVDALSQEMTYGHCSRRCYKVQPDYWSRN
jgi:hypothetical protein